MVFVKETVNWVKERPENRKRGDRENYAKKQGNDVHKSESRIFIVMSVEKHTSGPIAGTSVLSVAVLDISGRIVKSES